MEIKVILTGATFKKVYNFHPGLMKPSAGQRNVRLLMPDRGSTIHEVGLAMINSVLKGYPKQILEVTDIKLLAKA